MVQQRIYNYFERNPQLHVLFIFDKMDIISTDLREAEWADDYAYKEFDGAWFNLKYEIEHQLKDKHVVLLFPNSRCPHTEEEMMRFPLLDMLCANMEYKEDDYACLMQQYNISDKYTVFIKRNISELMSSKIMKLMDGYFVPEVFTEDVVCRAFISSYLGEKKIADWINIILEMLFMTLEGEEKKRTSFYYKLENNPDAYRAVEARLKAIFGFSYNKNSEQRMQSIAECLKYNLLTQLLDASPNDNYRQYKINSQMQLDEINKIYEIAMGNRQMSEKISAVFEKVASGVREENIINCYGIDAEYMFMTEPLCRPILKEIIENNLVSDPEQVNDRMRKLSLKIPYDSIIQKVVRFVELTALYYIRIKDNGTFTLNTPDEYIRKYTSDYYVIDMIYRQVLEQYHKLLSKNLELEQVVTDAKKKIDMHYAKIVNVMNLEWIRCVNETEGHFNKVNLPLQQDFYKNELDASSKKVVIVCDALRYEVAAEIMQELSKEKHFAQLHAMRTMLPTETKYCKPALLPHHDIEIIGNEMSIDGQMLITKEQRTQHVARYREGALCINYEEVMAKSQDERRELFKRPLVYVFYNTIDETSHSQNTFEVIRACRTAIQQLSWLVKHLHATLNVSNVYITSDHGFIYNDIKFEDKDKHSISEDSIEKKTRYYLTHSDTYVEGISKYNITEVSAMKSSTDVYVAVPNGTNRLAAPGGYAFAHGGATLQEMIIPMIHSHIERTDKMEKVGVTLMNKNLNMVSSQLKIQLIQNEAVSMTLKERVVKCCVYDGDNPVTYEKTVVLQSHDSENLNNRLYEISLVLNKSVNSSLLQLRIYDEDDMLNPLIKETVKNNTIIEMDEF